MATSAYTANVSRFPPRPRTLPDLNPIEQVFDKLKALLRKAATRTREALCDKIRLPATSAQPNAEIIANSLYAFEYAGKACLMTFVALSGKDGVLPARCELAGSGRERVIKMLAVMGRASGVDCHGRDAANASTGDRSVERDGDRVYRKLRKRRQS